MMSRNGWHIPNFMLIQTYPYPIFHGSYQFHIPYSSIFHIPLYPHMTWEIPAMKTGDGPRCGAGPRRRPCSVRRRRPPPRRRCADGLRDEETGALGIAKVWGSLGNAEVMIFHEFSLILGWFSLGSDDVSWISPKIFKDWDVIWQNLICRMKTLKIKDVEESEK